MRSALGGVWYGLPIWVLANLTQWRDKTKKAFWEGNRHTSKGVWVVKVASVPVRNISSAAADSYCNSMIDNVPREQELSGRKLCLLYSCWRWIPGWRELGQKHYARRTASSLDRMFFLRTQRSPCILQSLSWREEAIKLTEILFKTKDKWGPSS